MNARNKKLVTTIRVLFGILMVFSGISGLIMGPTPEGAPENMIAPTQALWDLGIFQMIKITEAIAGLMLVVGFLPALALLFLAPVAIGILVVNARMTPAFLPIGLVVAALTAYLGYAYWDKYKVLFEK